MKEWNLSERYEIYGKISPSVKASRHKAKKELSAGAKQGDGITSMCLSVAIEFFIVEAFERSLVASNVKEIFSAPLISQLKA